MSIESQVDYFQRWWRRLENKIAGKPQTMQILHRRCMNMAIAVLDLLDDIPFEIVSRGLYHYIHEVGEGTPLTRAFEGQIELAAADPEKFAFGLYKFFNETAIRIKKQDWYDEFFWLYYRCTRIRMNNEFFGDTQDNVMVAVLNLLQQETEFLKPDKFNLFQRLAGISLDGQVLLTIRDPLPTLDLPSYDFQRTLLERNIAHTPDTPQRHQQYIFELYRRYGYQVTSDAELNRYNQMDRILSTSTTVCLPFINEYNFDILSDKPFSAKLYTLEQLHTTLQSDDLKTILCKRNRTLPTNGVWVRFADNPVVSSLLLKETLYDEKIFVLYKLSLVEDGDLFGLYDTKDKFFYSALVHHAPKPIEEAVTCLVLMCYAAYSTKNTTYHINKLHDYFRCGLNPLEAEVYLQGGKLRNTYEAHEVYSVTRNDSAAYEAEERAIQGYIRKLPAGQNPSEEAVAYAQMLGYDLASDETYVRPFTRQVFVKKSSKDTGTTH